MIRKITIENFKSIDRLELDLGRVNVFIGENGCGKSNILEAISFGAAAAADKLDHEFLRSRGIRVTDPKLMRSAFKEESLDQPIGLSFNAGATPFAISLNSRGSHYSAWQNTFLDEATKDPQVRSSLLAGLRGLYSSSSLPAVAQHRAIHPSAPEPMLDAVITELLPSLRQDVLRKYSGEELPHFLAYTPHVEVLRSLELDTPIEPIGIHGEGLFKLLQVLEQEGQLPEIKQQLEMIDWFADLEVLSGPNPALRALRIHDQYLDSAVAHFDQRSANEGFLFLLLYTSLLISKYTPSFFAVDNVETGLNPKLCAGLIAMFARLTKAHDKQVLLTTHNPGTLDGLDLADDEQRLFVVYRNIHGGTRVHRVERKAPEPGNEPVPLSEAFLRGYLGGLPSSF